MASKRVMYRPAPQENVGQRRNRKPLSQGRLLSGDAAKTKPAHLVSGVEEKSSIIKKPQSPYTSFVSEKNNTAVNPRKLAPGLIEKHSPHRKDKADSLDLSDSDDDLPDHYKSKDTRVHKQLPSEVLLVDASRQTKDPNQSEVDIMVGFERSPVRVITKELPQINVDNLSPSEPCRSVDNFNLLTQIEKDMRINRLPQPNFDDSQDSDMSEKPAADDNQSNHSESDACSVKDLVTLKTKGNTRKKSAPVKKKSPLPSKTPQTAKKKSSRIVASRYLQAADAKVKTSLSVLYPKPTKPERSISKASRSMDFAPKSARKISRKTKDMSIDFSPRTVQKPKLSSHDTGTSQSKGKVTSQSGEMGTSMNDNGDTPHTPDNSHMTTGGQTSTPTHDGSDFPNEIDASAIHPEISVLSTGLRKSVWREGSRINHSVLSNVSTHLPPKKKKQAKLTQHQLDMLYARYIQSLYLSTKAQKVREEQEKQAMAQILGIYTEVEKLQKKNHEMDKELMRLKHLNEVDVQIDLQRQSLGPIVSSLPQLTKEYDTLAHALDTTRHQIPTKGVYIPDDEDQFQRDLEHSLLESEQLLGELSVMIRKDLPSVTAMANALSTMEKATETQVEELVRCNEMIAATQSLTIQETSMKIQAIQAKEIGAS
ncbi:HAUS8 [Mytilus coruscus]|uniref:HAUS8 n=1 Tax=Mytilus coruscus TaxID=42192 RepID=A0A6J8DRY1_MYTCO|nr:HAUS8 [Mytilus coruscus]